MARELICNECGQTLGDPIQSNIDSHVATTGHKDIKDREKMMDDGKPFPAQGQNPNQPPVHVTPAGDSDEAKETQKLKDEYPTKKEQREIESLSRRRRE